MKKSIKSIITLALTTTVLIGCGSNPESLSHSRLVSVVPKLGKMEVRSLPEGANSSTYEGPMVITHVDKIILEVEYDYSGGTFQEITAFSHFKVDKCSNQPKNTEGKAYLEGLYKDKDSWLHGTFSEEKNDRGHKVGKIYLTDGYLIKQGFITDTGVIEEDICIIPTKNYIFNNMVSEDIAKIPSDQLQNAFFSYRELP